MKSEEIRQSFIDYFVGHGHRLHASSPLVPHGDPTLLFTNAGMVQFKDCFLGLDQPESRRAVSVQKCMRVSGKHNDLENVGPSPSHHTFFEMLGNFSFGDYFKEDAIRFGWELVTQVWGLPPEVLSATVYEEDDEAAELWQSLSGLPVERIHRCSESENFWAMGETGPCGPSSEIFVDTSPQLPQVDWVEGTDSGRYLEIWNLVFMQYERDEDGVLRPLPNPSIDTGAGLERVAAVLQGVDSNYETDLFRPILDAAAALAGSAYGRDPEADVDKRVIADHLRAVAFLLADGVIPGNEGRGYVLRRILRRAVRHGMKLGFDEPFLHRLLPIVGEVMGQRYPELRSAQSASQETVRTEEEKFLSTVASASRQVQETIDLARREGRSALSGDEAFRFYDTYGLPLELIHEITEEEQMGVDDEGFQEALEAQRERSRSASAESQRWLESVRELLRQEGRSKSTQFAGYDSLRLEPATVISLAGLDGDSVELVDALSQGERGVAILDRTTFYAEAGGQVGDQGWLRWEGGEARVTDTQKNATGTHFHLLEVVAGRLAVGQVVATDVDGAERYPTQRNHTATHLLHLALRHVLGQGVRQAGSLVAPDRLRFDFTYPRPLRDEQVDRIEELVNRWVLAARETLIVPDRDFKEAVAEGATALFGEKYGDRVRTVEVADLTAPDGNGSLRSLELCGGCHVRNTGEIGLFLISMERGVASGVRRIEALTGEGALSYVHRRRGLLNEIAGELGVPLERAKAEISSRRERNRGLERELARLRMELVSGMADEDETDVGGIRILAREVPSAPATEIRNMADVLRSRLGSGVVVLGSRDEDKVTLVTAVTDDLKNKVHAGHLARKIAALVDGSGGGRSDFAQAGGTAPDKLPAALRSVVDLVRQELESEEPAG